MAHPTTAQQLGMAYAPMPFASISLLSSSYVVCHILCQQPHKRRRLYHRLVLAMNCALVPLSINYLLGSLAVPEGTEYYPAASGDVQTCTASGFVALTLTMTVPFYYGSLGMQAYYSIKNEFREEKIAWMEKWVHLIAWLFPLAISTVIAASGNFNPVGSGCSLAASPVGCDADPNIDCERGGQPWVSAFVYVVGFGQVILYFVLPPWGMTAVYLLIRKLNRQAKEQSSRGMQRIREAARKEMMRAVAKQIATYLLSFWLTFVPSLVYFVYLTLTGTVLYNLLIFAICIFASQGFVLTIVYFALPRMAYVKVEDIHQSLNFGAGEAKAGLTVEEIRSNAQRASNGSARSSEMIESSRRSSAFCIFDGTPDKSSPWAQFIDPEDYSEDGEEGRRKTSLSEECKSEDAK